MRRATPLALALVLVSLLAGCVTGDPPPRNPGGETDFGTVDSVAFAGSVPEQATAGDHVLVCWRVEGSGTIRETAIVTDTTSHADSNNHADYAGATYYPDNETASITQVVPATFCTAVAMPATVPDGNTVYVRAYAVADQQPGRASPAEHAITVVSPDHNTVTAIAITSAPSQGPAGGTVEVCWEVQGVGQASETALHTDDASHADGTDISAYTGTTYHPAGATAAEPVDLPGTFCADVTVPDTGTLYVRAHALDRNGPPGRASAEHAIESVGVVDSVAFDDAAGGWSSNVFTANPGENVTVCWKVEGRGVIGHAAIHTDDTSHPDAAAFTVYDGALYFPGNAESAPEVALPGTFCTQVQAPQSGALYLRAHAMGYGGAPGEISPSERQIQVYTGA